MRLTTKPANFVLFVIIMAVLSAILFITNSGFHALFETEFDAKIVDLRAYGRNVCPSFRVAAPDSTKEPKDIYYCPRKWSTDFNRAKIEYGMIARKNANSDTISFLDSNRRFMGYVIFK